MKEWVEQAFLYFQLLWHTLVFYTIPTLPETYYTRLGMVRFQLGHFLKAIALFERSEQSHDGRDLEYSKYNSYYMGYCYLNVGNFEKALDCWYTYLAIIPRDVEIIKLVGWCNSLLEKRDIALEYYQRLLIIEPDDAEIHWICANLFWQLHRSDEALQHLERAEACAEHPVTKELIRGDKAGIQGDLEQAVTTLKRVVSTMKSEHDDSLPFLCLEDVYLTLVYWQRKQGDVQGVTATLEEALEYNPNDLAIVNALAYQYARHNMHLEQAYHLIERALRLQPENPIFIDTKGWILSKMGRFEDAKILIEQSLALNPHSEEVQEHYHTLVERLNTQKSKDKTAKNQTKKGT